MVKKVAIVGAGPSGVLLAHYLLHRSDEYQIDYSLTICCIAVTNTKLTFMNAAVIPEQFHFLNLEPFLYPSAKEE